MRCALRCCGPWEGGRRARAWQRTGQPPLQGHLGAWDTWPALACQAPVGPLAAAQAAVRGRRRTCWVLGAAASVGRKPFLTLFPPPPPTSPWAFTPPPRLPHTWRTASAARAMLRAGHWCTRRRWGAALPLSVSCSGASMWTSAPALPLPRVQALPRCLEPRGRCCRSSRRRPLPCLQQQARRLRAAPRPPCQGWAPCTWLPWAIKLAWWPSC